MNSALTVLIVDDHDAFRASASMLLASEGFDVAGEAADGESAVAAARELAPDVVLLDVQLPDFDGFEVTRRVLADNAGVDGRPPIVVLTSSRDRADYGELIENCGARGFIPKSALSGQALAELLR